MRTIKWLTLAFVGFALLPTAGSGQQVKAGDLVLKNAWARATPGGAQVGGGYLTIENTGKNADKLLGGSTPAAAKVEVHDMAMKDGVMTMRPTTQGLAIPPGKSVTLAPGGYHLMLMNLKGPLKEGGRVPVTLQFENAGKVDVVLDIQGIGATGPKSSGPLMPNTDKNMKMN